MVRLILKRLLQRLLMWLQGLRQRRAMIAGLLVAVVGVGAIGAYLLSPRSDQLSTGEAREVAVDRLEQNPATGQITLVLKEKAGNRRLAMLVGEIEARTIFVEMQGSRSDRQLTYDLMREMVQHLGGRISRVVVNHVSDSTFYAKVVLDAEGRSVEVDSRPSDAIALALRARAPIYVDAQVLDKAAVATGN